MLVDIFAIVRRFCCFVRHCHIPVIAKLKPHIDPDMSIFINQSLYIQNRKYTLMLLCRWKKSTSKKSSVTVSGFSGQF